jgi:hypothetical protein
MSAPQVSQAAHPLMLSQLQADLLERLAARRVSGMKVAFLTPTTGESHLARPRVVCTGRSLDKNNLRIARRRYSAQNKRNLCLAGWRTIIQFWLVAIKPVNYRLD